MGVYGDLIMTLGTSMVYLLKGDYSYGLLGLEFRG